MEVYPAIDLLNGACVRLRQGDFARSTEFSDDPPAVARSFAEAGAPALHVVDLDGARAGRPVHEELVQAIRRAVAIPLQVGGGIRTAEQAAAYLEAGVDRVVLGTAALEAPEVLAGLAEAFGADRVLAAVDVRRGEVAIRGWRKASGRAPEEVLGDLGASGIRRVLYTAVERDGTLGGPDVEGARAVVGAGFHTVVAGGIRRADDLRALREVGVEGAVIGSALYRGTLTLADALEAARAG